MVTIIASCGLLLVVLPAITSENSIVTMCRGGEARHESPVWYECLDVHNTIPKERGFIAL